MITAYRIEHPEDGWGLFRHRDKNKKFVTAYEFCPTLARRHNNLPAIVYSLDQISPLLTNERAERDRFFSAFRSERSLKRWVRPDEIKQVLDRGFRVYELKLSAAIVTEHQIFFPLDAVAEKKDITDKYKSHE